MVEKKKVAAGVGAGVVVIAALVLVGMSAARKEEVPEEEEKEEELAPPTGGYRTKAEIEAATGEEVVDVIDWNRLNPENPIGVSPETTFTGSPAVNFAGSVAEATYQAWETGKPTYIAAGGYFVDEDSKYIKGAGW